MHAEGLQTLARVDIRDSFRRALGHNFRRYVLIEAWSPELAFEALRANLDVGTMLPTPFVVYELPDGETVITVNGPFSPLVGDSGWRRDAPTLAAIGDGERGRVAAVLARLQHCTTARKSVFPAA
jgi:Domain of unknown function DUF302